MDVRTFSLKSPFQWAAGAAPTTLAAHLNGPLEASIFEDRVRHLYDGNIVFPGLFFCPREGI